MRGGVAVCGLLEERRARPKGPAWVLDGATRAAPMGWTAAESAVTDFWGAAAALLRSVQSKAAQSLSCCPDGRMGRPSHDQGLVYISLAEEKREHLSREAALVVTYLRCHDCVVLVVWCVVGALWVVVSRHIGLCYEYIVGLFSLDQPDVCMCYESSVSCVFAHLRRAEPVDKGHARRHEDSLLRVAPARACLTRMPRTDTRLASIPRHPVEAHRACHSLRVHCMQVKDTFVAGATCRTR